MFAAVGFHNNKLFIAQQIKKKIWTPSVDEHINLLNADQTKYNLKLVSQFVHFFVACGCG